MIGLSSFIRFHALRAPDRPAIAYAGDRVTYAELLRRIEIAAGWLAARDIGQGDVVALLMKNSSAFIELTFATSHLGAVSLPINYRLAADEVGYILDNSGARLLLCDAELAATAQGLPNVVLIDEAAQRDSTRLTRSAAPATMHAARPDDLFRLMYTSGTTDRPKGVMHTYSNFYWKSADHVVALGLGASDKLLVAGPLYHVGAFDLPGMAVLWVGGMVSIERDFDPARALAAIAAEQLTGRLACSGDAQRDPHAPEPARPRRAEPALGGRRGRAHARGTHPRLRGCLHARALHRRLRHDRDLQRRHPDGKWPRDREDRLGRARAGACGDRDQRRRWPSGPGR